MVEINAANCGLFAGLDQGQIDEFIKLTSAKELFIPKDSYVFSDGDFPSHMYILLEGKVVVEKLDFNGKGIIVNSFSNKGTIFGEVFIILEDKDFEYSARAVEDTRVLAIQRDFLKLIKSDPILNERIMANFLKILAGKAYHLNKKISIHSSFSLRQKIANFLIQEMKDSPLISLSYTRDQLAEYIGTTRPSLSRELSNMESDGLIRIDGRNIEIVNLAELEKLI